MALGYQDIGAYQHKDSAGQAAKTGYQDIGAYQHQDPPAGGGVSGDLMMMGIGTK